MRDYPTDREEDLIDDLILNFIFYLTQENEKYENIDPFQNRKSILYIGLPILDALE